MERLTEKYCLTEDHYMKCSEDCNVDMACVDCPAFDKLIERLAAYEDTGWTPEMLHKLGENAGYLWDFAQAAENMTVGRLKELAEADKDGRVRIMPESQNETCGNCDNFKRESGTRHGLCAKRPHPRNRYGKIDRSRKFIVYQNTQSCKLYTPLCLCAERAMKGKT